MRYLALGDTKSILGSRTKWNTVPLARREHEAWISDPGFNPHDGQGTNIQWKALKGVRMVRSLLKEASAVTDIYITGDNDHNRCLSLSCDWLARMTADEDIFDPEVGKGQLLDPSPALNRTRSPSERGKDE
ncbi:hypothetical protein MMC29_008438, partial [Sticta canariensis]|nr:hypothetical protein [Sticta canariensis]